MKTVLYGPDHSVPNLFGKMLSHLMGFSALAARRVVSDGRSMAPRSHQWNEKELGLSELVTKRNAHVGT